MEAPFRIDMPDRVRALLDGVRLFGLVFSHRIINAALSGATGA
jgi:hypothetical protein